MRTIGKYQVLGLLGRGGMGAVYKVRHPELGLVAALKLLAPLDMVEALIGARELERRFLAEARAMAALRHDNVARVWDMDRDSRGRPFFIMEYCCNNVGALIGESYEVEAPSRILRIDRAADIARQALAGLARLHDVGIIHRDIKPFNLLVTESGRVRIIDFGLSKLRGERMRLHGAEQIGSPYYAAPEQEADPEGVGPRADLFAVGVTLRRMLTGRLPQLDAAPPSSVNPDLDAAWDDFLDRAAAPDPARRHRAAGHMADELDALMDAWRERTAGVCAMPVSPQSTAVAAPTKPRSAPTKTGPKVAPAHFGLDPLWRPLAYAPATFTPTPDDTVRHKATGLLWQRGGSRHPLTLAEVQAFIDRANTRRLADRDDWRLPTVPELVSLLAPVTQATDFCLPPVFDPGRPRLWSADLRTHTQSWTADTELGCITRHDHTCRNFARLVAG